MTPQHADSQTLSTILAVIQSHPDIRILRRIPFMPPLPGEFTAEERATWKKGLVLDTETTGLDVTKDKIIELGLAEIWFSPEGEIRAFGRCESWFQDPGVPIPAEVTAVNGITDEMVHGQAFPAAEIASYLKDAVLFIAHNARFDRRMCERCLPLWFTPLMYWACSVNEIEWKKLAKMPSTALTVIAWACGVFFDAHRATADCNALAYLLALTRLGSVGKSPLQLLIESARRRTYRVFATGSDFNRKDELKAAGYEWDADRKVWFFDAVDPEGAQDQRQWLQNSILGGRAPQPDLVFDGRDRHSDRV